MNKLKYIVFCGFAGLFILSSNFVSASTPGEKLDDGIEKTKDAYENAKDKVKDTYDSAKDKTNDYYDSAKEKYNESLEKAKTK